MAREKSKNHTVIDMYRAWTKDFIEENPNHTLGYDHLSRLPGVKVIYNPDRTVYMSYTLFRCIIETFNKHASQAIIHGASFDLGGRLGYLFPARIERSFSNLKIDTYRTIMARRREKGHPAIYFTNDEYCIVKWHKMHRVKNESVYKFHPAHESLKSDFSKANMINPALRVQYRYYPVANK